MALRYVRALRLCLVSAAAASLRGAQEDGQVFHLVYGPAPSFCMSSTRVGDGISLELWECDGTWKNQQQNFRREGALIRLASDPSYCMVSSGTSKGAGVRMSKCEETREEDKSWKGVGGLGGLVAGPWNTCLAVDGKAQNGADLELLDYGSCSGSQGSQYWVQAVPGPKNRRSYAVNPAFSETGAATFSGCTGNFQNVQSAEECAEAARKLYGNVGEVQVISDPDATRGCFLESKSVCGQPAKLKYNIVGMEEGSFENCDEADCCYGITSFCML